MTSEIDRWKEEAEAALQPLFTARNRIAEKNQRKVLEAFRAEGVSDFHFAGSTGYGYDDQGREKLEHIYARVFEAEAAIVRPQLISGTHAISTVLFGILRPGDEMVYVTGKPYDTLEEVIGADDQDGSGSLRDFGISYREIPLKTDGQVDVGAFYNTLTSNTKLVGIQRSRGYDDRPSLTVSEIETIIGRIRETAPQAVIFVDNCYGEFVEEREPTQAGADIIAGSLIKNPGGGLAKIGGYIAGRRELIERCGNRLTAPGIGLEGGPTLQTMTDFYQGFFLAPHVVNEAMKGALFTAHLLSSAGMDVSPRWDEPRTDLIQSVAFPDAQAMIAFCQSVQAGSPVDAHVTPNPSQMPGYQSDVIMAAGTFVQGSSIELTADGPIRPPYRAYIQGGLTFEHVKITVTDALKQINKQ
ncbi:aminotransferase class I/II-fold pyridoxal phosphate-dependent enzyme [Salisediminibacterium halotolerans]|uniref:methionine gamma-lyase family protein n=1 Tax=Salisediminibacterium halotolerans TaxID=517425 RepID=UPI000EB08224|nr:methionine gamma-lyase family protein [Salisediminibacterium halotolerans]RLJ74139.1 cystathionine beta-lyase family protein involved in aluminum resistance [Actinophytocola xinjiangensis]RPE87768.1 cystathionine beta-lyase family protein involved in aluminum resistance [Salisediminibacterium halotolerans]TWG34976.1 cystathionine beta-lyase family protein involved in aluminum resistance [Salisediminibacterium halotolerans]GEL07687.1 hypothetical protein SHA02_11030 [Salisediminibacterium hal